MIDKVYLIPLLPLLGFLFNAFFGWGLNKSIGGRKVIALVACAAVGLACLVGVGVFWEVWVVSGAYRADIPTVKAWTWIESGDFKADVAFKVDPLSVVMVLVVTFVGFFIHLYSVGYMAEDKSVFRFFSYLNLFTFAMLILVLADNMLLMFVGWEGVGLCSYLLIGYVYDRPSAAAAGLKAFVVNRIGDFAFITGMVYIYWTFGTLNFSELQDKIGAATGIAEGVFFLMSILLFIGATGKSAQIPLYVWLPDAMEGPTPVSALIHAATMVTSGVYMITRMNFLFNRSPEAMWVVATVGALTAIFAASIGLVQTRAKRVLAYSTVSQLGFMFLAVGLGAYTAGMFHLTTHAFFKACLFLGAGSVMHALGEHKDVDIFKAGKLRRKLHRTAWTFLVASLAIAGFPLTAGFFSKDEILWSAVKKGGYGYFLWFLGATAALMTAFYMFRLFYLMFEGRKNYPDEVHPHESPSTMTIPLVVLAIGSLVVGFLGVPASWGLPNIFERWLAPVVHHGAHEIPGMAEHGGGFGFELLVTLFASAVAIGGIFWARSWYKQKTEKPEQLTAKHPKLFKLLLEKYRVDEMYDAAFIRPIRRAAGFLWGIFDDLVVDGAVNLTGFSFQVFGEVLRMFQTGLLRNYALFMLMGTLAILLLLVV